MSIEVIKLALGPLGTNGFVLRAQGECWVADPGMEPEPMLEFLAQQELSVSRILLTHGHCDHIAGIEPVKQKHPQAIVTCPAADAPMLQDSYLNMSCPFGFDITAPEADELVNPGDILHLGDCEVRVLDTSGHTPGGVSYYFPSEQFVLVGDALFAGSVGRCDIPGANYRQQLANIRERLYVLPEETTIYAGHGPQTTIGTEKETNPYTRD
ncbi:MAG: MBL fold metallo-hydrolase [Phycisphaerae bacterium]